MFTFVAVNTFNAMKRTLVNIGAALAAFLIGLAINSACADSLQNMSDSELRNLVAQLQKEVDNLRLKVAELEKQISDAGSSTPSISVGFDVDGLHFNNAGQVEERIDRSGIDAYSYYIIDGKKTENTAEHGIYTYSYDSFGRLSKQVMNSSASEVSLSYNYSGKSVITENVTKYKNPTTGSLQETYSKSTTTYK